LRQEDETSFGPQPGPEMLPDLVERVRAAGLEVDLELDAPLEDLPQALGVSVFRLVQESLTNVLRHAGQGATAAVRTFRPAAEHGIEVLDDGRVGHPGSERRGHGLRGVRERLSVVGGILCAGPLPARGYRVRAGIPLEGGPAPSSSPPTRHLPGETR